MNKRRRKELSDIIGELMNLREQIEMLMDEEQECFDNLGESLQQTERGETMENAIAEMDSAMDSIDDAIESLETASE